ncbi:asparaginase [Sporosarcina sp. ANT_H38]|uniref:asparaginase n=1 Tax=Sporosarcina sp. ANT_H38 TaxID=2597358 RepID=UPI0011F1A4E3|nr:asparaginase [Sporosarcina sp. ANT_H38]KAA0965653.1 asparaginase [Sporosarcina sp. ANT_H38]
MDQQVLVQEYRNDILENVHLGVICGINAEGDVLYSVGDQNHMTFLRSAAKPFQAIPVIQYGVDDKFGLTSKEAALFAASHRGEDYHIEALESILHKTGIDEDQFYCCPTYPLNEEPKANYHRKNGEQRKLYHNCSGKHSGFIALAKVLGYDIDGYWDLEHPVQQLSLAAMADMSNYPKEAIGIGIDGCGFPVYAMPLQHIAQAYLKLACPDLIQQPEMREAVVKITGYMNAHPEMIASHDFICSVLLTDPNIVAKGGAKGVYGFALRKERMSFALKVMDGSELVWPIIVASILEQIGYENQGTIERLYELSPKVIINDNLTVVGERKIVFDLQK